MQSRPTVSKVRSATVRVMIHSPCTHLLISYQIKSQMKKHQLLYIKTGDVLAKSLVYWRIGLRCYRTTFLPVSK